MGKIADALPKTVHLDKVTAGNILASLKALRILYLDRSANIEAVEEEIDALASAIQVAEIDATREADRSIPRQRCGVGFNFGGARCILSAGHPGRHEFTR